MNEQTITEIDRMKDIFATKSELFAVKEDLRKDINELRKEIKENFKSFRQDIRWTFGIIIGLLITIVIKLFFP